MHMSKHEQCLNGFILQWILNPLSLCSNDILSGFGGLFEIPRRIFKYIYPLSAVNIHALSEVTEHMDKLKSTN